MSVAVGQPQTNAQVLALIRQSLALWQVAATVSVAEDGRWLIALEDGSLVRVGRAPPGIPFRWLVVAPSGRERPASSVAGLLRVLRATLDPAWRPGRARVVAVLGPVN